MIYVHFDETTRQILSYFVTSEYPKDYQFPEPVMEIGETQWAAACAGSHNRINEDGTTERYDFRTLDEIRSAKKSSIRSAYDAACSQSVDVGSVLYDGGFDSAVKLDAAMRLAQTAGAAQVTFYDSENDPHILDMDAALAVVLAVSSAFSAMMDKKQALFKQIETAEDIDAVLAIAW